MTQTSTVSLKHLQRKLESDDGSLRTSMALWSDCKSMEHVAVASKHDGQQVRAIDGHIKALVLQVGVRNECLWALLALRPHCKNDETSDVHSLLLVRSAFRTSYLFRGLFRGATGFYSAVNSAGLFRGLFRAESFQNDLPTIGGYFRRSLVSYATATATRPTPTHTQTHTNTHAHTQHNTPPRTNQRGAHTRQPITKMRRKVTGVTSCACGREIGQRLKVRFWVGELENKNQGRGR